MIVARAQYDDRPVLGSDLDFSKDPGLTKQGDAKDCDINAMFKRFEKTGQLPDMIVREPHYGDYSAVPDYQEAVNIVRHAEEQFMNLDAHVRNRFDNDPGKFLAFATDERNLDELEKLGLLKPEVVAARAAARQAAGDAAMAEARAKAAADERALIDKIKAEIGN